MRIALDATYSVGDRPSGIGRYSRELLRDMPVLYPDDDFLAYLRWKQWRLGGKQWPLEIRRRPKVQTRLLQWPLPAGRPDVFHALNQRVDRRPARHVAVTFHDLFVMCADYSTPEFRRRFTRQAVDASKRADLIIAVSEFTAGQVCDLLHVERQRIRVVPHGVHLARLDIAIPREPVILFVGALQKRKNLERLISAFEHTDPHWRLVLAGSDGGYGAIAIHQRIASSPRRNNIEITGYLSEAELQRQFARASIFAFPSLDEGFGMPILEAMRSGLPVLTSLRSATAEIGGDAAVLVDPLKVDSISEGLIRLTEDEGVRAELIRRGFERAKLFPWSRTVHETYNVYRELLSDSDRHQRPSSSTEIFNARRNF